MKIESKAKIGNKMAAAVITACALLSFTSLLHAEDYPAGYLGAGYREYLGGKILSGYFVEEFSKIDVLQNARVDKRNEIEKIVSDSYQATPEANQSVFAAEYQQKDNSENLKIDIFKQQERREQVASTESSFNYIKYSDGKIEYFKDGLVDRIENERVADEFGNIAIRNTYNMKYNDKRLLISYDATQKDILGNVSKIRWWGATYTGDSVYYGNKNTNANRSLTEYYMEETDGAGNVKTTHWKALSYEGKFLRAFSQSNDDTTYGHSEFTRSKITYGGNIEQAISYHEEGIGQDNLPYVSDRSGMAYNDRNQLAAYHEETITTHTEADNGNNKVKTITDAKFTYKAVANPFGPDIEESDPNRILESIVTTTIENPDGSTKTETATTNYDYDSANKLIGASGHTEFSGQEAKWIDAKTNTAKEGNKYKGNSKITYELFADGKPVAKEAKTTVSYSNPEDGNNFRTETSTVTNNNALLSYTGNDGIKFSKVQLLSTVEHEEIHYPFLDAKKAYLKIKDITTTNSYDVKGNLIDTKGAGLISGYDYNTAKGFYNEGPKNITAKYRIYLGRAQLITYDEVPENK